MNKFKIVFTSGRQIKVVIAYANTMQEMEKTVPTLEGFKLSMIEQLTFRKRVVC